MLLEQQQLQLLRVQCRGLEFNLTEKQMLTSLLLDEVANPHSVGVYEASLQETINISNLNTQKLP